jgi:tRNA threonylcarbamoyladenosine biosynthesis protein TsaB
MKILAVDTSTEICSICISDSGNSIAEYVSRSPRTHTERLLPAIHFLLSQTNVALKDLDVLAVVHGPGSFTGLRISLSTVKGLAFALNRPVLAFNALEAAADQIHSDGWICPAMDAKRGEIFTALYRREKGKLIRYENPVSISPSAWKEKLPEDPVYFCGPGASLYLKELRNNPGSGLIFSDFVLARTIAESSFLKFQAGEAMDGGKLRAAYLRPSDAELKGARSPRA